MFITFLRADFLKGEAPMTPNRVMFWQIDHIWIFYMLAALSTLLFLGGMAVYVLVWKKIETHVRSLCNAVVFVPPRCGYGECERRCDAFIVNAGWLILNLVCSFVFSVCASRLTCIVLFYSVLSVVDVRFDYSFVELSVYFLLACC